MTSHVDLRSKFLRSLLGTAPGRAVGQLAFARPTKEILLGEVEKQPCLVHTDDSAMTASIAHSAVERRGLVQQHLGDALRASYIPELWRGYASSPPTVFSRIERKSRHWPSN